MSLLPVPWRKGPDKMLSDMKLPNEPEDDQGVGPVGEHRGTKNRLFRTTLRVSRAEELLGLAVGHFNAPAHCITCNALLCASRKVRIEEHTISVLSAGIMA